MDKLPSQATPEEVKEFFDKTQAHVTPDADVLLRWLMKQIMGKSWEPSR